MNFFIYFRRFILQQMREEFPTIMANVHYKVLKKKWSNLLQQYKVRREADKFYYTPRLTTFRFICDRLRFCSPSEGDNELPPK